MDHCEFMRLFEPQQKNIYFLILGIVRDPDDADDVFQDTALKGYASFSRLRDSSSFNAWISRIAVTTAYDCVRKRKRHVDIDSAALPYYDSYDEGDEELRQAMMTLDDKERLVVTLKAVSGLKHREIASIIKKPENTVRTIYARAIRKLSDILQSDPEDMTKGGAKRD